MIIYPDGNSYCQHADGTQMLIQDKGQNVRVEKEGFSPVVYQTTERATDLEEWLEMD